ncbi:SDR family NAD(P)-dependent oxidoreductase [Streptomyces malaysiensis]|uniref:SDR family NAD(P)-dependent oxidoreductase n=1 Tax=Streptomyces malaysiensis TaxID=92644 RepID=UPI002741CD1D|nr:SDR family NAD(P)-dependent oxidoreductase [Streptomyces samsunensis]
MAQRVTGRLERPFDVLACSPTQGGEQEGGAGGRGLGGHDSSFLLGWFQFEFNWRSRQSPVPAGARINAVGPATAARFISADLASLSEVRDLADRVVADGALSVLVNNVGAMFDDRRVTPDGIEASFALNHLSRYLLTELLLPALRAGAPSRVVNVTSGSVRIPTGRIDTAEQKGGYYGLHAYGRAKLANLAYTPDMWPCLAPVTGHHESPSRRGTEPHIRHTTSRRPPAEEFPRPGASMPITQPQAAPHRDTKLMSAPATSKRSGRASPWSDRPRSCSTAAKNSASSS